MDKKDEKIEYALRTQADENLPDADSILVKARAEMRQEKQSVKGKKLAVIFASVAACAVMILTVALCAMGLNSLLPGGGKGNAFNSAGNSSHNTYSAAELRGREIDYSEASEAFSEAADGQTEFPLSRIDVNASAKYYIFTKSASGEDVLLKCDVRVYSPWYGFDDLTIYFELGEETFEGNAAYTQLPNGLRNSYERGEYVSRAYLTDGYRCMLCVMNAKEYRIDYYLSALFGVKGGDA